jgi:ABC-type phosphate transport system permease subunit
MAKHPEERFEHITKRVEQGGMRPRSAAYVIAVFWTIAVVVFGVAERLVDPSSFDSVWLGMWWAVQTVTTVGYGDVVPTGTMGKLIGTLLMIGGLSLLSVVTAVITSSFVDMRARERRAQEVDKLAERLDAMASQLEELGATSSGLPPLRREPEA